MKVLLFIILMSASLLAISSVAQNAVLKVGDKAPDFELVNQDGELVKLSDFKGKKVALYFYPKDSTPGCTQQACSLRDNFKQLEEKGIVILGLSKGSVKSKQKFINAHGLTFPLLIATDELLKKYGVNTGFWRAYLPKRQTFLIDENGIIIAIIEKVKTKNHAEQILEIFETNHN